MEVYGFMADEQTLKGMQIKSLIDERNNQIKEMMTPNFYALNNGIRELLKEVEELQNQCPHKWDEDNFCVYCYKMGDFC
jgi:hypothetical protein